MEVRALRESEQEECIALWRTVWPGDNDAYFRRYFEGDVEWLPYYTQVAIESGRLVSAVHICKRTVACGDFKLQMGGIANVATLPDFRGKGLNSACLRAAITVMEADALDFSLLFTGINGYYAKQGYANLPRARLRGTLRSGIPPPASEIVVREAKADDLSELYAVYDAYNASRPIAVQRTAGYWRDWIGLKVDRLSMGERPLVAVAPDGRLAGYVFYGLNFYPGHQITEDYAYISEYGEIKTGGDRTVNRPVKAPLPAVGEARTGNGDTSIAEVLFQEVATRALASGKRELHMSIALDSAVRAAIANLCERTSENVTESGMARLLNRESLLRSFLMEWNDRWIAAGRPTGEASFYTPYGAVRLDASRRFLRVEATDTTADTLSQSDLLGLLFGATSPHRAARNADQLPLLEALFPVRDGIYWSADGF